MCRRMILAALPFIVTAVCGFSWVDSQHVEVVVPALVESLNDPFLPIRRDAADALGEIGPRAEAAIPALIEARDYKPKLHPKREALKTEGPNLPTVEEMSEEEFYTQVRDAAIKALSKIERTARNGSGF